MADNPSNLHGKGTECKYSKLTFEKLITNRPLSLETTRLMLLHPQDEATVS